MAQVRCPRCGALNDDQAPGYPICTGCEENLSGCPYCLHFAPEREECAHPEAPLPFSPLAARAICPKHEPRLQEESRKLPLHPALRVLLLAAGPFVLFLLVSSKVMPPADPVPQLQLAVEIANRKLSIRQVLLAKMEIYNRTGRVSAPFSLRLPPESLANFDWSKAKIQPAPTRPVASRGERRLYYNGIQPGDVPKVVLLKLPLLRPRPCDLTAKLFIGEDDLQGQVKIPVPIRPTERPKTHTRWRAALGET